MTKPHDKLFKWGFSKKENAIGEFKTLLPPEIFDRIDWSTLSVLNQTQIEPELREKLIDLVFSAQINERHGMIYVLFEHQSTHDSLMQFRMLKYIVGIWSQYLRDNPDVKLLPAIIPIVLHHSEMGWNQSTQFIDLIDCGEQLLIALRKYLPDFEFLLDDLTNEPGDRIYERPIPPAGKLILLSFKYARHSESFTEALHPFVDLFLKIIDLPEGKDEIVAILEYALRVSTQQGDEIRDYLDTHVGQEAVEAYMTAAEKLIEQGREEGIAKGIAKGRAEERADLLLRQLEMALGPLPESVILKVKNASYDQLGQWADRVVNASTLDNIFK